MHQRRNAYLIGANGPEKQQTVTSLKYAEKDIERLQKALSTYPCEFASVESVVASTPFAILPRLELLANSCERGDLLMVHFAGHAFPWGGHLYLICNQTNVDQKLFTSTAVDINAVKAILNQCRAKHKLLVLDCCHAGTSHGGGAWRGEQELKYALEDLKGSASIILSACASHKRTRELDTLELDNEYGAGFLSWALSSAFTKEFTNIVDDQSLSFTDFWKWLPEALRKVNKDLKTDEQIPTPLIFREEESGPDNEIWFTTSRRNSIRANIHDGQRHQEELAILEHEDFLQQYCFGTSIEDFDREKVMEYAQKQGDYNRLSTGNLKELCRQLDLTSSIGTPRRSAVLLFHRVPNRYLHSALIRLDDRVENNGTNVTDKLYIREEIIGPLSDQVEKALKWIISRLQTVSENIGAGKRIDRSEIPEKALREIVVNAIVHRDYEARASARVRITPKQIIITNPGQLNSAIVNSDPPFAYRHSQARNPFLLDVFIKLGWAEGLSQGFEIVMEEFGKYGLPVPKIENLPSGLVQVTIQRPDLRTLLQSESNTLPISSADVFCSYAPEDESLLQKLHDYEKDLRHQGIISTWYDRQIIPDTDWAQAIDTHLETASLILLLVSANFLASNYCYGVEMQRAIQRQGANVARVIPIIVRPCDWTDTPFAGLQCLPHDGNPVTEWSNRDSAWHDVVLGIRRVIEDLPLLAASAPRAALSGVWNVPYSRNPHFTGRDELLNQLHQQLTLAGQSDPATIRRAALTQPHAIKGLGGIGKTQIAVEYAYRSRDLDRYTHTLWINAATEETIMTSFMGVAELLPSFSAKGETDQQKLVEAVKRWLVQCEQQWLLIFDNADDLSLVRDVLPQQGNGSILLTSRASAAGSLAESIEVENMGLIEGASLLLHRAQRLEHASEEELNEAINIVIALDAFPLVLDQAGAYIEETGCSLANYLEIYQSHRKGLLARRGLQRTSYPDSVVTTWSLSFQKVEQANSAAAELLHLCAFLAPDKIPEELIRGCAALWSPPLQQAAMDIFTFNQMISELLRFSLIKRQVESQTLSIHRLVQAVQIDMMEPEVQRLWAERVIRAVNDIFPDSPEDTVTWPLGLRYLDQAQACSVLAKDYQLSLIEAGDLLNRTGLYLHGRALYPEAEPLYQDALHIREQQLGPEHPQTAAILNNLAGLYYNQGKYEEAEPLYQRALAICEQTLGPNHPQTAASLNNLAELYRRQGKYEEAEPLYQRALAVYEQILGPNHPDTATSLNNLAGLYDNQSKYEEAEPLYLRALVITERILGPEHPQTQTFRKNFAILLRAMGKDEEAKKREEDL